MSSISVQEISLLAIEAGIKLQRHLCASGVELDGTLQLVAVRQHLSVCSVFNSTLPCSYKQRTECVVQRLVFSRHTSCK